MITVSKSTLRTFKEKVVDTVPMRRFHSAVLSLLSVIALPTALSAKVQVLPVPVPPELKSTEFTVLINGKPVDVAHAAASYDYVNIEASGPIKISITAAEDGFWDRGVDVQPWRLGIRPLRRGKTIEFELKGTAKLSISQPGDFLNHAKMLFVFVSPPAPVPPKNASSDVNFHFVAAGVHRESLNPKSGETWYLAPGAVIFGSLNLWKVDNVKVLGRGVIVYDGPQNPENDDGWMQKPDWHCIGALESHHIQITGVTCLVRSRTWSIQMKDSGDFVYDDIRVIGGNPGNANQDGMDWLGGGDTVVRNSFFRASDDVLAMQGNWDGYLHDAMVAPGHDVQNILVENSVLSTSISNIVRAGWPQKTFNSHNFTLRNSDILHGGIGSCGPPFALFTFWGANGAKGSHAGFTFENLRMDDWYSLFQIEQEEPALQGFTFRNIWGLDQPPLIPSTLKGQIKDVRIDNVKYGQAVVTSNANLPVAVTEGTPEPVYAPVNKNFHAAFHLSPAVLETRQEVRFIAETATGSGVQYTWLFGDGTTAHGRQVKHRFADADGTLLDGGILRTGRFRVLLHVTDKAGHEDWAVQGVNIVARWNAAQERSSTLPGLEYQIFPGTWPALPSFKAETAMVSGIAQSLVAADASGFTRFAAVYEGLIEIPTDGGYSFQLMARDGARLMIDGQMVVETGTAFAEVCGSPINAMRYARGAIGLRTGKHTLRLESLQSMSPGNPRLLWEGPGISLGDVPASAFSRLNRAIAQPTPGGKISVLEPQSF